MLHALEVQLPVRTVGMYLGAPGIHTTKADEEDITMKC